jgi:nitrogen fixation NifU-like protein
MYNKTVLDYFFSPKHVGFLDLNNPLTVVSKNSQNNQEIIELYLQGTLEGTILKACFKTNGSPYIIAGLEWLCRQIEGKELDNLPPIDYIALLKDLNIPKVHYHVALRIIAIFKEGVLLMNEKKQEVLK